MIGLAGVSMLLLNGKIAGISGILGRSFFAAADDLGWRIAFLAGLPVGAWITTRVVGEPLEFGVTPNAFLLTTAGLLVGVGTQLGNGCTSGHGVCGIGRGSTRSIVATLSFMVTAAVTLFVARHMGSLV